MSQGDGRRLVLAGRGEVTVRDSASLRIERRLPVHSSGATNAYALSHDGSTLAFGGEDGSVGLLDMRTGDIRKASGRHAAPVVSARFTGDGRTLVTTGDDADVILWDTEEAVVRETLSGHSGAVGAPALTGDGRTLYTPSEDGSVFIWDLEGARRLGRPFRTAEDAIERGYLAVSPDGRALAMGQADGSISITDARTLEPDRRLRITGTGQVLAEYLPDSRTWRSAVRTDTWRSSTRQGEPWSGACPAIAARF